MSVLFFCWSLAVLLFWIVLCLDFRRGWPRHLVLPDDPPPTAQEGQGRELAVVIPARNEAQTLAQTLPSLLEHSED